MPLPYFLTAAMAVTAGSALADNTPLPQLKLDLSAPLGSPSNPVRAHSPAGEREYLRRLRCLDGQPPKFERVGSLGKGPYGNIVDGYTVECPGAVPRAVVMDMYHQGYREPAPLPGFAIAP